MSTEWEPIFTVSASTDPRARGAVYLVRFGDGTERIVGDAERKYGQIADLIDDLAESTPEPQHACGLCDQRLTYSGTDPAGIDTWTCLSCGWWHTAVACCQRDMEPEPVNQDHPIPLPGESLNGGTVVASVIINDTDHPYVVGMCLLLMPEPPFYMLVDVFDHDLHDELATYPNIVPAVEAYSNFGGDY